MKTDKQLRDIKLACVLEKRRLGQALNMKEFAVLAGVSYSVAREWFQLPGFPRFEGVVFWQDFVDWRNNRNGKHTTVTVSHVEKDSIPTPPIRRSATSEWPARAAQILLESTK